VFPVGSTSHAPAQVAINKLEGRLQPNMFQGLGAFPVALVIFAGLAVFLVLRLRSVLGKRVGFEKPPVPPGQMPGYNNGPIIEGRALPPEPGRAVPDPRSPLGERLMQIVNRDAQFDPPKFLTQAETAFRMIVTGFAAGDRTTLKNLLSDSVFQTFDAAIAAREAANQRQRTDIKAILSAAIEDAQIVGDEAAVVVRFTSDQVNVTLDANNSSLGTEAVTELTDLWTFTRNLQGREQTWRLAAARTG
jgi:predicted lipid-binding transport protein (Tim44 family)